MTAANGTVQMSRIVIFVVTLATGYACVGEEHLPATGKTFAWVSQNVHFYDAARFANAPIKEQLENAIVVGLEARGLRFVASLDSADLGLSYIVVLENEATPKEIATFREAHPHIAALPNDPEKFEGGMLFAKLVNRQTRVKLWDNTYRGIVAFDMPAAPRRERMSEMVTSLLSTYKP